MCGLTKNESGAHITAVGGELSRASLSLVGSYFRIRFNRGGIGYLFYVRGK